MKNRNFLKKKEIKINSNYQKWARKSNPPKKSEFTFRMQEASRKNIAIKSPIDVTKVTQNHPILHLFNNNISNPTKVISYKNIDENKQSPYSFDRSCCANNLKFNLIKNSYLYSLIFYIICATTPYDNLFKNDDDLILPSLTESNPKHFLIVICNIDPVDCRACCGLFDNFFTHCATLNFNLLIVL